MKNLKTVVKKSKRVLSLVMVTAMIAVLSGCSISLINNESSNNEVIEYLSDKYEQDFEIINTKTEKSDAYEKVNVTICRDTVYNRYFEVYTYDEYISDNYGDILLSEYYSEFLQKNINNDKVFVLCDVRTFDDYLYEEQIDAQEWIANSNENSIDVSQWGSNIISVYFYYNGEGVNEDNLINCVKNIIYKNNTLYETQYAEVNGIQNFYFINMKENIEENSIKETFYNNKENYSDYIINADQYSKISMVELFITDEDINLSDTFVFEN